MAVNPAMGCAASLVPVCDDAVRDLRTFCSDQPVHAGIAELAISRAVVETVMKRG